MKHPKKKPDKQKRQSVGGVTTVCKLSNNSYHSRHSRWRPYKRKNRHPRVSLPIDVFAEWRQVVCQAYPKPERQVLEDVVKATELLYANMANGEVTVTTHTNNVETPLTHILFLTRVLLTAKGERHWKSIWANASPEAYSRARNVARFTDMPINVVFSIAIYLAVLLSRPSTTGLKAFKHPSFLG